LPTRPQDSTTPPPPCSIDIHMPQCLNTHTPNLAQHYHHNPLQPALRKPAPLPLPLSPPGLSCMLRNTWQSRVRQGWSVPSHTLHNTSKLRFHCLAPPPAQQLLATPMPTNLPIDYAPWPKCPPPHHLKLHLHPNPNSCRRRSLEGPLSPTPLPDKPTIMPTDASVATCPVSPTPSPQLQCRVEGKNPEAK